MSPVALVTRVQLRTAYWGLKPSILNNTIRELKVAKGSRFSGYYYWKRDADALFEQVAPREVCRLAHEFFEMR